MYILKEISDFGQHSWYRQERIKLICRAVETQEEANEIRMEFTDEAVMHLFNWSDDKDHESGAELICRDAYNDILGTFFHCNDRLKAAVDNNDAVLWNKLIPLCLQLETALIFLSEAEKVCESLQLKEKSSKIILR